MSSALSSHSGGGDGDRWVVVGGGVHGTHLTQRLVDAGVSREDITVVERTGKLLGGFRDRLERARVDSLRSPYVHHVGTKPFSLENYAKAKDREDELLPTHHNPRRPTVDLFIDHADRVIERRGLQDLVLEAEVTGLSRDVDETVVVETDDGELYADRVLLAVGDLGQPKLPTWSQDLDTEAVEHVWRGDVDDTAGTVVVGGGSTACSLAVSLARETGDVTLLTRHALRRSAVESDPRWLNWPYIEKQLHHLPEASEARYRRVEEAREDGSVPHHLAAEVEEERESDRLEVRYGEVETAVSTGDAVELRFGDGGVASATQVVLATGSEEPYGHPFVRGVADSLDLARGYRGMPVLDDDTLAWKHEDGRRSPVHVTGRLAEGVLGAFARNVAAARRAGDRVSAVARRKLTT